MDMQLFEAVELGCVQCIRDLLSREGNIAARNYDGNTLLHIALMENNAEIVELLIDYGIDLNTKNNALDTPLNFAIYFCLSKKVKSPILNMLIKAGANVITISNKYGAMTTLQAAVFTGDVELVQRLIVQGADVNVNNNFGTALHCAAVYINTEDPSMFETLLSSRVDVNAVNSQKETALHQITKSKMDEPLSLCRIVEVFFEYGADFDAKDIHGRTPLDCAIENSYAEAVEAFVLSGAVSVNCEFKLYNNLEPMMSTILHADCYHTDLPTIKVLVENGANIDALDEFGQSPLHKAVISCYDKCYWGYGYELSKDLEVVEYLLRKNANVNTIDKENLNILMSCRHLEHLPPHLWQMIVEHLAMRQVVDQGSIHANLLDTIDNDPNYSSYFHACIQELELARDSRVCERR